MTDRELLERAAKVAGYTLREQPGEFLPVVVELNREWNPITDDGDALRLAVKLHLALLFPMNGDAYPKVGAGQVGGKECAKMESAHPDPYAATRRAIVRAAAAMAD